MASIRERVRRDGTVAYAVLYTIDDPQSWAQPQRFYRSSGDAPSLTRRCLVPWAVTLHGADQLGAYLVF